MVQQAILRQDGKIQHHLVHLAVAVATDAEQVVFLFVEQADYLLGVVVLGQRISGAVVEKVSQQQQPVRLLPLESVQQRLAAGGVAVDIRGNHQSQGGVLLYCSIDGVGLELSMLRMACRKRRENKMAVKVTAITSATGSAMYTARVWFAISMGIR